MALEVTFFSLLFCHLIYACLCGSIALILQYKDKATQRDGMKRLFEVISKSIQLQALALNCFPLFWIPLLFLDAGGNEDVHMESQKPGTVLYGTVQVKAPAWMVCDNVLVSVQTASTKPITDKEGAHIDLTLISKGCELYEMSDVQFIALDFTSAQSLIKDLAWSVLLAAEE